MLISVKSLFDPQRINAYSYTRNNPLKLIDPDGADPKEPKIETVNKPYSVHGKTADEAFQDAHRQAAGQTREGGIGEAQTDYKWQIMSTRHSASRAMKGGGFGIDVSSKDVEVTITVTIITPQWSEYKDASPEEQKKWDDGSKALQEHEDDHKKIWISGGQQIQTALENSTVTGQGKTPQQALQDGMQKLKTTTDQKATQINDQTQARQDRLDKDTEHGKKPKRPGVEY